MASLLGALLSGVLLAAFCMPASATTLLRCKLNHKIVYSDTDCPADASGNRTTSRLTNWPASKPVTIRYPRKKAAAASGSKKTASR